MNPNFKKSVYHAKIKLEKTTFDIYPRKWVGGRDPKNCYRIVPMYRFVVKYQRRYYFFLLLCSVICWNDTLAWSSSKVLLFFCTCNRWQKKRSMLRWWRKKKLFQSFTKNFCLLVVQQCERRQLRKEPQLFLLHFFSRENSLLKA